MKVRLEPQERKEPASAALLMPALEIALIDGPDAGITARACGP